MEKTVYTSIKACGISLIILLSLTMLGSCSSFEKKGDKQVATDSSDSINFNFEAVLDSVGDTACGGAPGCFSVFKVNLGISAVSQSEPIELAKVADSVSFDLEVSIDGEEGMCYETHLYDVQITPCPEDECDITAESYPKLDGGPIGEKVIVDHPASVKFGQSSSLNEVNYDGGLIVLLDEPFTDSCGTVAVDITNFIARKGGEIVPSEGK
mgnify:CR=1 FL=1